MIDFNIDYLFPSYLLHDQNGSALAKGFMAGLNYMMDCIERGMDVVFDVTKMPEWRLDELAWEQDQIYNYSWSEEDKRRYLIEMANAYEIFGTKAAVKKFIHGENQDADVQEWFDYGGQPYHYSVILDGRWVNDDVRWDAMVLDRIKNVRSILDKVQYREQMESKAYLGLALSSSEEATIQMAPAVLEDDDWLTDEQGMLLLDENSRIMHDKEA